VYEDCDTGPAIGLFLPLGGKIFHHGGSQHPGLYLELGNFLPEALRDRAGALAQEPGVFRITWWENCLPGRDDLPMRVTDGSTLFVAEADDRFKAPAAPSGSSAHHFRRHTRPSQGILTGRPTTGLLVVWISPRTPDLAEGLRDWADFVHIRHIAAAGIPGFTQISVYENVADVDPRYMHFYEFDSEDAEATFQTMTSFVGPRLAGIESDEFGAWANWRAPGGRLFYCNTFRLLGALDLSERK
jgi:hypothetical protein